MQCYGVKQALIWFAVGGVIMIVGGIFFIYMPDIIDDILALLLPLAPGSIIYPVWQEIPVPIYRKFYLYNYTNVDKYLNDPIANKLQIQQIGPYVYREVREKVFIKWTSDGKYVNYRETHTYPFIPELSSGPETDIVKVPNLPVLTVLDAFLATKLDRNPGDTVVNQLFVDVNVTELIWSGHLYKFLQWAETTVVRKEILPGGMFALFYGKNATDDCEYQIDRGTKDLSQQFEIHTWNGSELLPYWEGHCNMINGSDGTMYSPKLEKGDRVYIFVSDICRSIYMDYIDEQEYKGYKGHRFVSGQSLFDDPGTNPDNRCFCGADGNDCYAPGVTTIAPCKFGAPIYISHPNMLYVAEYVRNQTIGQNPIVEQHRSEVIIEPNSGMLLWVDVRFQINVLLSEFKHLGGSTPRKNITFPEQLLPVLWVDEAAQLDDARIDMLRNDLFIPMNIANAVPIVLMSVGAAVALIGITCMISLLFTQHKAKNEEYD